MSSFRTRKVSDPSLEPDRLRFVTVKSEHLGGRGDVTLFVPDGDLSSPVPLVLLLHGVYGSHWSWAYTGGAHRTAHRLIRNGTLRPMVIAMPSDGLWGDGSGYLPHSDADFEAWITDDVVTLSREVVDAVTPSSPLLISGLSMGGYGALRIGAGYGERFDAISAHSSITRLKEMSLFVEESLDRYREKNAGPYSVFRTMVNNRNALPPVRFDCGRSDDLFDSNQSLHRKLEEEGIPHTFERFAGGHEWSYWREHLEDTLLFFENILSGA